MSLAVLPESPALVQPGEATLEDPALGHDLEGVQLAALGDLHRDVSAQDVAYALPEWRADAACVCQQNLHSRQTGLAAFVRLQRPLAARHLGCRHRHGVGKPLRVHRYVALDPRDLFARVIALHAHGVRVLHALRVHDQ